MRIAIAFHCTNCCWWNYPTLRDSDETTEFGYRFQRPRVRVPSSPTYVGW